MTGRELLELLAWIGDHGFACWIDHGAIVVAIPWVNVWTDEMGETCELVHNVCEARDALGY